MFDYSEQRLREEANLHIVCISLAYCKIYIYIIKEESQSVPNDIGSNNNYIDMKNAVTECNPTLDRKK